MGMMKAVTEGVLISGACKQMHSAAIHQEGLCQRKSSWGRPERALSPTAQFRTLSFSSKGGLFEHLNR